MIPLGVLRQKSSGTAPATGKATPATGKATPATGTATPATGTATPATGTATPAPGKRVAGLDGVRGLAVLLVVLSHAKVQYFGPGGIEGVTTFFTLSGFLISGLLFKEHRLTGRLDLPAFWGRRALRLLPALFAFVGITGVVFWVFGWGDRSAITAWSKPVLLYYGNIEVIRNGALGPFRHTWSLAVEEQFYLFWPLLLAPVLLLLRGRRRAGWWLFAGLVALTALSLGWRLVVGRGWPSAGGWVALAPQTTVFSMTAGACLAVAYERGWRPGRWAGPVAVVGLTAYFWLPGLVPAYAGWITGPVIYTGIALILIACTAGDRWTVFAWRPIRALGTVSYGWYLWHFPFTYAIAGHLLQVRHHRAALWLGVLVSLVIAALSWRYLEQPLQRRYRHRLERVRLAAAAPVGACEPGTTAAPATGVVPGEGGPAAADLAAADPVGADLVGAGPNGAEQLDAGVHAPDLAAADVTTADGHRVIDLTVLERKART